ncbi:MAG: hypothetical protein Q8R47_00965 [Nanoarchaeota archaeon]|nr:hypothetical protein [Nanoarchaeota archaeon]
MVKIEVFSTTKEANEKLKIFIFKNGDAASSLVTELLVRGNIYRTSAEFGRVHPLDPDAPFTKEEMQRLCKNLRQKEKANSFVRLYSIVGINQYGFTYASLNPYDCNIFNSYDSVKSLAKRVHQEVTKEPYEVLGLKTVPVLYTILEALPLPEEKRQQVRESPDFQALTLEQKIACEQELDNYRDKGLTATEIDAFICEYVKFFN